MRTSPLVHVNNLKRYNTNQEDIKHKETTQPHKKEEFPSEESRRDSDREDTKCQRTDK